MKKIFFSLLIAVTGIGFYSFRIARDPVKESFINTTLYFQGDAEDPAQVANELNWTSAPSAPCPSGENKACMIQVDQTQTDLLSGGVRRLKSSFNLTAIEGENGEEEGFIPSHPDIKGQSNRD